MDRNKDNGFESLEKYPESNANPELTEEEFRELHGERIVFQGCGECLALRAEKRDLEVQLAQVRYELEAAQEAANGYRNSRLDEVKKRPDKDPTPEG